MLNSSSHWLLAVCEMTPVDAIFILDESGSVGRSQFELVKEFVINIITQIDVDGGSVRVGVMTFSDNSHIKFNVSCLKTVYMQASGYQSSQGALEP